MRTRPAYALLACVLGAAVYSGYGLYGQHRDRAIQQFQDQQHRTAQVVAATLRSELQGLIRALRAIADATDVDPRLLGPLLDRQGACGDPPCFSGLAVYDSSGAVRHVRGQPPRPGAEDLSRLLAWTAESDPARTAQILVSSSPSPSLIVATRIHAPPPGAGDGSGGAAGLLAGEVSLDSIFSRHREIAKKWQESALMVIEGRGRLVFHSQHPEMELNDVRKRTAACFNCHSTLGYVDRMIERREGVVDYTLRGVPHLAAFAAFDVAGDPWVAAVLGRTEQAVGIVVSQGRQLALLMLAAVVAVTAAAALMWRDGRRRLQAEADAAREARLERTNAELTALNARLESAALEWRATVDTIDGALIVLEPFGAIERMNRAATELLPGEPFAWLGRPSERLAAHPPWDCALEMARDASAHDTVLTSRVHREATGRTWDLWCRASRRAGRDVVVVVARDVTALVDLQESLRRSETMAALGSIIAGVAHEVRNPLFAISSLVDAWSVQKDADGRRFHQALRNEVGRLKSLMNDLLEYGTPSKSTPHPLGLSSVVHEAVRSCTPEAEARQVRLEFEAPAAEPLAWVDPQRFVRVLINLVQNAVQYSPAESTVTVSVSAEGHDGASRLLIAVRDRGPGFRDDDVPHVFTPFFSRRPGGFGLGLAISERIVSEHRGTLTAANHPDGGGLVTISLPASPSVPDRASEGASSDDETPPARRRRPRHPARGPNVPGELRVRGG
jgi:signal transduction histidine kinase